MNGCWPNLRCFLIALTAIGFVMAATPTQTAAIPNDVQVAVTRYCVSCHGQKKQKGKVRLDTLSTLTGEARIDLLNRMHEAIRLNEMPPEEEKQPTPAERKLLDNWLDDVLAEAGAAKLDDKLKKPEYGNYVDHDKLFSGEYKDLPGFTYDRRWLISEYIFDAKFQRMLQGKATATRHKKRVTVFGSSRFHGLSLTNPFLLPNRIGVRYYASTDLTGGHLSSMLTNAQKTSEYITGYLVKRNKKFVTAINQIMALEDQHHATLESRKQFLEQFIARVCADLYGDEHEKLLPAFKPVTINELKKLEEGEKYKKAPVHVAMNMLKGLEGEHVVYQALLDPANKDKSDAQMRELCERTWFYFGDHERKIQGRMTLLRDYLPDYRANLEKNSRRYKLLVYKPLSDAEMKVIHASIRKHRKQDDRYSAIIEKCMAQWEQEFKQARIDAGPPSDKLLAELVDQLFTQILERKPDAAEADEYLALSKSYVNKLGNLKAIQKLIQTLILTSEFVYRDEFGSGEADKHGRRMMSPRDASYAIAYALTDQSPDEELAQAAASGKLNTREDYAREIKRLLAKRDVYWIVDPILADKNWQDNTTNATIRKLRFFREFFGYPKALTIFKDEKRFGTDRLSTATHRLVSEADRLVEYILENDQDVFEELLTTERFYVYHDGDNERMQAASDRIKRIYAYFDQYDWEKWGYKELGNCLLPASDSSSP